MAIDSAVLFLTVSTRAFHRRLVHARRTPMHMSIYMLVHVSVHMSIRWAPRRAMPHLADAIVRRATAHSVGCFFPLHITSDAFFRCTLRWMLFSAAHYAGCNAVLPSLHTFFACYASLRSPYRNTPARSCHCSWQLSLVGSNVPIPHENQNIHICCPCKTHIEEPLL